MKLRLSPAARISAVYLFFAALWVIVSSWLLNAAPDVGINRLLAQYRGAVVAAASAVLIYALVRREWAARQRSEAERCDAEQRLAHLFDVTSDAIIGIDERQTIILFNRGAEEIFGYAAQDVLGQPLSLLLPPDRSAAHHRHVQNFARAPETSRRMADRQEIYGRRRDGTLFPAEASIAKVVRDGSATYTAILRDITRRKDIETAEHEQRVLAEALRDTAAVINSTLDLDEVMDRILAQASRVVPPHDTATIMLISGDDGWVRVGRARGYLERGLSLTAEQFALAETPTFRGMAESGQPLVIPDTHADSGWLRIPQTEWIRSYVGAPIRSGGQVIGFINLNGARPGTFSAEHAERLQAFADQAGLAMRNARLYHQLRDEQAELSAILGSTGEGIFYSEGTTIVYVNRALCRLTGYKPEELRGQSVLLLRTEEPSESRLKEISSSRRASRVSGVWWDEARLRRKDGSTFDAALTISLISEAGEVPARVVTLVRDVTQEKLLKERQYRFITHAAHELRHPITNLVTRLYLARRQREKLDEHLDVLDQVTAHLKNLSEAMLEVSQFEQGATDLHWSRVTLQNLIADVLRQREPEAEQRGATLRAVVPETPLRVWMDPVRIARMLSLLISNAIGYTPPGRAVTVEAGEESTRRGRFVMLHVRDEGPGIPPEELDHIFQPFHWPSEGGVLRTGLELTIVRDIVALHGGEITVTSESGRGATFSVRLAALSPDSTPVQEPAR